MAKKKNKTKIKIYINISPDGVKGNVPEKVKKPLVESIKNWLGVGVAAADIYNKTK